MSTNSIDNKFGLPKPDFHPLPKKKIIWPVIVFLVVVAIFILSKLGYSFYLKKIAPPKTIPFLDSKPVDHSHPINDPKGLSSLSSTSFKVKNPPEITSTINVRKNSKIRESISGTKKKLAAKRNKPLVKPGTYQELKGPQGIYHLVVVSHLDKPSAMKEVEQLRNKNLGVYLILPRIDKGEKYYRVTIGHSNTQHEADQKLKQFNSTYSHMFVLKY